MGWVEWCVFLDRGCLLVMKKEVDCILGGLIVFLLVLGCWCVCGCFGGCGVKICDLVGWLVRCVVRILLVLVVVCFLWVFLIGFVIVL